MENRLVVSLRLYQRVIVKSPAGMKPASQRLRKKSVVRGKASSGGHVAIR
jgi:ribosomal protein S6E (S10)